MFDKIKIVYMLGIGGIGMSALARYFNILEYTVAGYDKTPTALTDELIKEGIDIHFEDEVNIVASLLKNAAADEVMVIYTPAIPKDHRGMNYLNEKGYALHKRSEILGMISRHMHCIAIAGTHGKTTTSSMVAHMLKDSGYSCNAFLGGITTNYNTNLLLDKNAKTIVVEADEFDRSFLKLFPDVAVITSMDADHLDIYGNKAEMEKSYNDFAAQVKSSGKVIAKTGLPVNLLTNLVKYAVEEKVDYFATNVRITNGVYTYDMHTPGGEIKDVVIGLPGRHNVENSVAAFAVGNILGIDEVKIKSALATFKGVKRRFEYILKTDEKILIDDYAHHPEELRACISSVKEMYPGKKVLGVFQPHLFTRTRDFANEFARSLELLDEVVLLEIYPARELPIEGVNAEMLLKLINKTGKKIISKQELPAYVKSRNADVVLTLGAGDIDKLVEPIKAELLK